MTQYITTAFKRSRRQLSLVKSFLSAVRTERGGAFGSVGGGVSPFTHNQPQETRRRLLCDCFWNQFLQLASRGHWIALSVAPSRRSTEIDWITTNYVIKSKTFPPFSVGPSIARNNKIPQPVRPSLSLIKRTEWKAGMESRRLAQNIGTLFIGRPHDRE